MDTELNSLKTFLANASPYTIFGEYVRLFGSNESYLPKESDFTPGVQVWTISVAFPDKAQLGVFVLFWAGAPCNRESFTLPLSRNRYVTVYCSVGVRDDDYHANCRYRICDGRLAAESRDALSNGILITSISEEKEALLLAENEESHKEWKRLDVVFPGWSFLKSSGIIERPRPQVSAPSPVSSPVSAPSPVSSPVSSVSHKEKTVQLMSDLLHALEERYGYEKRLGIEDDKHNDRYAFEELERHLKGNPPTPTVSNLFLSQMK
jgi:hypothetical protein